jgi:hypothetical protein
MMVARASIQSNLEWRRYDLERADSFTAKYSVVQGAVYIGGAGEALAAVAFPVLFFERPIFTFGHELADNTWPVAGQFPVASASIAQWDIKVRPDTKQYWVGAELAICLTGPSDMRSHLHFRFSGQAFRNPVSADTNTTDTL